MSKLKSLTPKLILMPTYTYISVTSLLAFTDTDGELNRYFSYLSLSHNR